MAGTTWDLVVLSSSPPAAAEAHGATSPPNGHSPRRVAMPAPSPLALSAPASPQRGAPGASKPRRQAAPIPEGTVRGFATVGKLVQSEYFAQQLDDVADTREPAKTRRKSFEGAGEPAAAPEKPRKRPKQKQAPDSGEQPKQKARPRARKPKADTDNAPHDPELRLPAPGESPFFANHDVKTAIEPRSGAGPAVPDPTKSAKPRKARAKKQKPENSEQEPDVGAKPKGHRVARRNRVARNGKLQRDATSTVSAHFRGDAESLEMADIRSAAIHRADDQHRESDIVSVWEVPASPRNSRRAALERRPPGPPAEGLDLEEAVTRRRDWTPPPEDTATQPPSTDSVGKENRRLVSIGEENFNHLVSNFAYAQSPPVQADAALTNQTSAVSKRRRVELVEVPNQQNHPRNISPDKGRGPKKKPRTITDLVTKQYASKIQDPTSYHVTSGSLQSTATKVATKVSLNDISAISEERRPKEATHKSATSKSGLDRTISKPRSKRTAAKSVKSKPVAEKLLSPTSAATRMHRQDILFGTSSQLALQESPTTIRQLQFALKTSEADAESLNSDHVAPALQWPRLGNMMGMRGLWAASARDNEGGVLDHANVVYVPGPDRTQNFPLLMDGTHDEVSEPTGFIDIDDIKCSPPISISSDFSTHAHTTALGSAFDNIVDDKGKADSFVFDDIDNFEQEPPPSNQNADSSYQFADIDDFNLSPSAQMDKPLLPKSRPPATVLADSPKKIPKKGLKPSSKTQRTRTGTSCSTIPTVGTTMPISNLATNAPTMTLTSPKPTLRFMDIEEILDSEEEALETFSPTPPRIRKLQNSPPLALVPLDPAAPKTSARSASKRSNHANLVPILLVPSSHLQWAHIKDRVCKDLTAYIRSLPPSTDPKSPSWHEKILMYEPIVLEDFTAYLNANAGVCTFKKATQKQIKAWNQMLKSSGEAILTVSQNKEEVLATEKELEPYMVQCWCESLSICCIWGEGRGKPGARKGLY